MNKKDQNQTATIIIVSLAVLLIVGIVGYTFFHDTYAAGTYNIVFHYAQSSDGVLKTCRTDSSGKINSNCADYVHAICHSWSTQPYTGGSQSPSMSTSEVASTTHTSNITYYCVSQASTGTRYPACLECISDRSIYHWGYRNQAGSAVYPFDNGTGDTCSPSYINGQALDWKYSYDKTTEDECSQCFQCKADTNVYKWASDAWGDGECPGGYRKTNKSKADCKTVTTTSSTSTTTKSTTTTTTTKKPTPACYECKADKNIMKWKTDATGDNACPGGYDKTTKTQAQCDKEPVNPPTGQTGVYFTLITAIVAMVCSIWYLKRNV